jgi:predicted acyltransferase
LPWETKLGGGIFRPGLYRIPGVLQRIGICYGLAATVALFDSRRAIVALLIFLFALYSVLMLAFPLPAHVKGSLTKEDNFARASDEAVFDRYRTGSDGQPEVVWKHTYGNYPDPEGIVSTLPAIGSVLIGILVGLWLASARPAVERCAGLMAWGVIVTVVGVMLNAWLMPINKQIWTTSFTVFTAGLGMLGLGVFFWVMDVRGRRRWALPLVIYGMNAIAAYVAAGLLVRIGQMVYVQRPSGKWVAVITVAKSEAAERVWGLGVSSLQNTSLAYSLMFVLVVLLLMSVLYVCRIFVKV